LLALERKFQEAPEPVNRDALLKRLDEIESAVNRMKIPASFADLFYALRGHIDFVRNMLTEESHRKSQVVSGR
jgi:hypothetical protein